MNRTPWLPKTLRNDLHEFIRAQARDISLGGNIVDDSRRAHAIVTLDFALRLTFVGICRSERYAARINHTLSCVRDVVNETMAACVRVSELHKGETDGQPGPRLTRMQCDELRDLSELQVTGARLMLRIARIAERHHERMNAPANDASKAGAA